MTVEVQGDAVGSSGGSLHCWSSAAFLFLPFYLLFAILASGPPGQAFCLLGGRNHSWK